MSPPAAGRSCAWLDRRAGRVPTLLAAVLIVVASAWLMADSLGAFPLLGRRAMGLLRTVAIVDAPVRNFRLRGDDFRFLAESRAPGPVAHPGVPREGQVAPLFRLGTFALAWWAGGLGRLRATLAHACFGVLVLVMLAAGRLVARETRDQGLGMVAMAGLGVTTVIEPAVTWFAASATLWAALLILGMLLAFEAWRSCGGWWRLMLGGLAALLAPAAWSGGFAAGPAGWAYLWADRRRSARSASAVPLAATALAAIMAVAAAPPGWAGSPTWSWTGLSAGLAHACQAIPEVLVLNNLGLDVSTTASQAIVFCLALAALWTWSRGGWHVSPLEAAGAALVASGLVIAAAVRARFPHESLRPLDWDHAIPQVGAVLFAAGWWTMMRGPPAVSANPRPAWRSLFAVAGLTSLLLVLHTPRAQRILEGSVYPRTASERLKFPIPTLQRLRAIYLASDLAERQDRFLARLDRAQRVAVGLGIGKNAIRRVFGRLVAPGWPNEVLELDAVDLLALPDDGPETNSARIAAALRPMLFTEREPRPDWIPPGEIWPPRH